MALKTDLQALLTVSVAAVVRNTHTSTALDATDASELTLLPFAWEVQ